MWDSADLSPVTRQHPRAGGPEGKIENRKKLTGNSSSISGPCGRARGDGWKKDLANYYHKKTDVPNKYLLVLNSALASVQYERTSRENAQFGVIWQIGYIKFTFGDIWSNLVLVIYYMTLLYLTLRIQIFQIRYIIPNSGFDMANWR